jgi:hypothetical protein
MTGCNESQDNESTEPVGANDKKPTVNPVSVVVPSIAQVSEPGCTPECGSMVELVNTTMRQLCFVDQDDSHGPSDANATSGAHDISASLSQHPSKKTVGWEKRGRFTIWPVSIGDDHHI